MLSERGVILILRLGLAFAFLYPPISAYFDPLAWIGYFPSFVRDIAGENEILLLHTFGIVEIIIALWLLWGKYLWCPSITAAIMLLGIFSFNTAQIDVLFRDLSILCIAIVLAILSYPKKNLPDSGGNSLHNTSV